MSDDLYDLVQRAVGWLTAAAFIALAYLSMDPGYELTAPVIVGVIVVIAMLLGKVGKITELVDSWRN